MAYEKQNFIAGDILRAVQLNMMEKGIYESVSVNEQELTEEQKAQARANIGAAAIGDVSGGGSSGDGDGGTAVRFTSQNLTEGEKAQARMNINAASKADVNGLGKRIDDLGAGIDGLQGEIGGLQDKVDTSGTVTSAIHSIVDDAIDGLNIEEYAKTTDLGKLAVKDVISTSDMEVELGQSIVSLQQDRHSHDNKGVLDGITESDKNMWQQAYAKMHQHENRGTLDSLTDEWVASVYRKSSVFLDSDLLSGIDDNDLWLQIVN